MVKIISKKKKRKRRNRKESSYLNITHKKLLLKENKEKDIYDKDEDKK